MAIQSSAFQEKLVIIIIEIIMHKITNINMPGIVFQAFSHVPPLAIILLRSPSNQRPSTNAEIIIAAHFM